MSARRRSSFVAASLAWALALSPEPVLAADAPSAADATERVAPPRLFVGTTLGAIADTSLTIDGRRQPDEGDDGVGGVSVRYAMGLLPFFGVSFAGRLESEATEWASDRGETRVRADLCVGPELVLRPNLRKIDIDFRLELFAGPTFAWFDAGERLAVSEDYSAGHGWNFGGGLGMDAFWGHHGAYAEVTHLRHLTWISRRSRLEADRTVRSTEHFRYVQAKSGLGFGYVYRF